MTLCLRVRLCHDTIYLCLVTVDAHFPTLLNSVIKDPHNSMANRLPEFPFTKQVSAAGFVDKINEKITELALPIYLAVLLWSYDYLRGEFLVPFSKWGVKFFEDRMESHQGVGPSR